MLYLTFFGEGEINNVGKLTSPLLSESTSRLTPESCRDSGGFLDPKGADSLNIIFLMLSSRKLVTLVHDSIKENYLVHYGSTFCGLELLTK